MHRREEPLRFRRLQAIPPLEGRIRRSSRSVGALAAAIAITSAVACGVSQPQTPVEGRVAYDFGDHVELSELDGSGRSFLVRTPRQRPGDPVWSRDGSAIALRRHVVASIDHTRSGLVVRSRAGDLTVSEADVAPLKALLTTGTASAGDLGLDLTRRLLLAGLVTLE